MKRALLEEFPVPVSVTMTKTGGFLGVHEEYQAYPDGEKYYISFADKDYPARSFLTEITEEQYHEIVSLDYSGYLNAADHSGPVFADDFHYENPVISVQRALTYIRLHPDRTAACRHNTF